VMMRGEEVVEDECVCVCVCERYEEGKESFFLKGETLLVNKTHQGCKRSISETVNESNYLIIRFDSIRFGSVESNRIES
jgi:hypothetical protein